MGIKLGRGTTVHADRTVDDLNGETECGRGSDMVTGTDEAVTCKSCIKIRAKREAEANTVDAMIARGMAKHMEHAYAQDQLETEAAPVATVDVEIRELRAGDMIVSSTGAWELGSVEHLDTGRVLLLDTAGQFRGEWIGRDTTTVALPRAATAPTAPAAAPRPCGVLRRHKCSKQLRRPNRARSHAGR